MVYLVRKVSQDYKGLTSFLFNSVCSNIMQTLRINDFGLITILLVYFGAVLCVISNTAVLPEVLTLDVIRKPPTCRY